MSQDSALNSDRLTDAKLQLKGLRSFSYRYRLTAKLFLLIPIVMAALSYSTLKASATEAAPSIVPNYQVFSSGPQTVTISDTDGGAVIHFTTNGATPTSGSPTYTGSFNVSATTTVQAIAIGSGGTSGVATSVVQIDASTASVPRTNLVLWHKADNGAITSGGNVTSWVDVSGGGYTTTGVNGTVPFTASAINGLPALNFSASQYFYWPSGFSAIGPGASVFVACKPTTTASGALTSIGNGGASDALDLWEATGGGISLYANNGSTQSVVTASGALNINGFQILEGIHNGTGTATLFRTGTQIAQNTAMQNLNNVTRGDSYIGSYNTPGYFSGQIAEILVYSAPLSTANRQAVEQYLWTRYVNPPTMTPGVGVFSSTQAVTLTGSGLGTVRYTTNGSAVTSTSPVYSTPFTISASTTVNAAEFYNGAQSATTTAFLQLDPTTANIPRSGLLTWQKADYGVTTSGGGVTNWTDVSGNGENCYPISGFTNPTYTTSAVNGLPAVTFDGVANALQWPPGFSNLTAGMSVFVTCKPASPTGNGLICSVGNTPNYDAMSVWQDWNYSGGMQFFSLNGTTSSQLNSNILQNQYQSLEFIHNGAGTVTAYVNGVQMAQNTAMQNFNNLLRSQNYIGDFQYGNFWPGNICEMLIYNRPVTSIERGYIEMYLAGRYLGPAATAPLAPIFSLAAGTLNAPTQLGISGAVGGITHATTDGTTPTSASPVVTGAIQINYSEIVKAISIVNGVSSAVTSSSYTLDATKYPAPSSSDTSVMQINLQAPSPAQ